MFHEKQKGSYCRCHAINNLFGQELLKIPDFNKYCDEYDKKNGFISGSSKNAHLFYNNGGDDNIFGYILKKKNISFKMIHYDFYASKKIEYKNNSIGYIIYNRSHTFCVRIINRENWIIDSMRPKAEKIGSMNRFEKKGFGLIQVISI